jgi:hypothetical protein
VLEIISHDQKVAIAYHPFKRVEQLRLPDLADIECSGNRGDDLARVTEWRKVDETSSVRERGEHISGNRDCQSSLACAGWASQRDEARVIAQE